MIRPEAEFKKRYSAWLVRGAQSGYVLEDIIREYGDSYSASEIVRYHFETINGHLDDLLDQTDEKLIMTLKIYETLSAAKNRDILRSYEDSELYLLEIEEKNKELEDLNRELATAHDRQRNSQEKLQETLIELEEKNRELMATQEKLVQAERLALIGQVAVSINHEINNPLSTIVGNVQLMIKRFKDGPEDLITRLKSVEENAYRINETAKKLNRITSPVTKDYAGGVKMLDIEGSIKSEED
jgi:C4-dicarboxylate-specific signal transduction histidine kinase